MYNEKKITNQKTAKITNRYVKTTIYDKKPTNYNIVLALKNFIY